jgi:hypothetical protein
MYSIINRLELYVGGNNTRLALPSPRHPIQDPRHAKWCSKTVPTPRPTSCVMYVYGSLHVRELRVLVHEYIATPICKGRTIHLIPSKRKPIRDHQTKQNLYRLPAANDQPTTTRYLSRQEPINQNENRLCYHRIHRFPFLRPPYRVCESCHILHPKTS